MATHLHIFGPTFILTEKKKEEKARIGISKIKCGMRFIADVKASLCSFVALVESE